jgi:hypothetical protein
LEARLRALACGLGVLSLALLVSGCNKPVHHREAGHGQAADSKSIVQEFHSNIIGLRLFACLVQSPVDSLPPVLIDSLAEARCRFYQELEAVTDSFAHSVNIGADFPHSSFGFSVLEESTTDDEKRIFERVPVGLFRDWATCDRYRHRAFDLDVPVRLCKTPDALIIEGL